MVNKEGKTPEEVIAIVTTFSCIYGKRGGKRIVQTIKEESGHG